MQTQPRWNMGAAAALVTAISRRSVVPFASGGRFNNASKAFDIQRPPE